MNGLEKTLVGKINNINEGDLVQLNIKENWIPGLKQIVGFVLYCNPEEIELRNTDTKIEDGSIRDGAQYCEIQASFEEDYTIPLSICTSYKILKKYKPSKH